MKDQKIKNITLALLLVILFPILDACEDIGNNGSCSGSFTEYYDYSEVTFSLNENEEEVDYVYFELTPSSVEFIVDRAPNNGTFGGALMADNLIMAPLYDIVSISVMKSDHEGEVAAMDMSHMIERFDYSNGWVALSGLTFYENNHVIQLRYPKSLDSALYDLEVSIEKSNGDFALGALSGVVL